MKATCKTIGIDTITYHCVDVEFTYRRKPYKVEVTACIDAREASIVIEPEDVLFISDMDDSAFDAVYTIAVNATKKYLKEYLKTEKEGRTFDTFLDLSREDVRGEGYDDKELPDPEMAMLAEDVAQEDALMEAWHDTLSELLETRGIGHLEDTEF